MVANRHGDSEIVWPTDPRRYEPRTPYIRCDVINHGASITDLQFALQVRHGDDANWSFYNVSTNPVDQDSTFSFAIVNECPLRASVLLPRFGTAKLLNEAENKGFTFLAQRANPVASSTMSLQEAKLNPTGMGCSN